MNVNVQSCGKAVNMRESITVFVETRGSNLLRTQAWKWWRGVLPTITVGVLLAMGWLPARGAEVLTLEEALRFFEGDMLIVSWSADGQAQLHAIINALKLALDVPVTVDESSEESVDQLAISEELRPIVLRLTQAYFELGNAFSGGDLDALAALTRGKHWGLKGLRMSPQFVLTERDEGFEAAVAREEDVGLLFWTCLCWLRCAEANPVIAAVAGTPAKALAMLERCVDLDSTYAACGPFRALAGYWGGLPDLPLIGLRRNLNLALEYSCYAITADPLCPDRCNGPADCERFLENRLTFVKYYLLPNDEMQEARRVLVEIITASWDAFYPLHNPLARHEAELLVSSICGPSTN